MSAQEPPSPFTDPACKRTAEILAIGREFLRAEGEAVLGLCDRLDDRFAQAVELVLQCTGRVVVTGIGKSGMIARKIAATLASTGTPALFLHAAEGMHGDLGMITRSDVVLAVSNSGETDEVLSLIAVLQRFGTPLLVISGGPDSTLARHAAVNLEVRVPEGRWPMNVVPSVSTTAALAMGDALALSVLQLRGFKLEEFAQLHPGGSLGRRLLIRVEDVMHRGSAIPKVRAQDSLRDTVLEMSAKRLGMTLVVDEHDVVVGIITDGDLRRQLQKNERLFEQRAADCMTRHPHTIGGAELAVKALEIMERHSITSLAVVDPQGHPEGVLHLHDLLRAKLV